MNLLNIKCLSCQLFACINFSTCNCAFSLATARMSVCMYACMYRFKKCFGLFVMRVCELGEFALRNYFNHLGLLLLLLLLIFGLCKISWQVSTLSRSCEISFVFCFGFSISHVVKTSFALDDYCKALYNI